jgi:hypothetical protein
MLNRVRWCAVRIMRGVMSIRQDESGKMEDDVRAGRRHVKNRASNLNLLNLSDCWPGLCASRAVLRKEEERETRLTMISANTDKPLTAWIYLNVNFFKFNAACLNAGGSKGPYIYTRRGMVNESGKRNEVDGPFSAACRYVLG